MNQITYFIIFQSVITARAHCSAFGTRQKEAVQKSHWGSSQLRTLSAIHHKYSMSML